MRLNCRRALVRLYSQKLTTSASAQIGEVSDMGVLGKPGQSLCGWSLTSWT